MEDGVQVGWRGKKCRRSKDAPSPEHRPHPSQLLNSFYTSCTPPSILGTLGCAIDKKQVKNTSVFHRSLQIDHHKQPILYQLWPRQLDQRHPQRAWQLATHNKTSTSSDESSSSSTPNQHRQWKLDNSVTMLFLAYRAQGWASTTNFYEMD
jgi:hypothetical protein